MKFFSLTLFIVIIISCAPIKVHYDYDQDLSFESYKTYQYYADMNTGLSELDTNRLLDAIDDKMALKGYSISETPDFFIDIKSKSFQEVQRSSVGIGMGGSGSNVGGGLSIGIPVGQSNTNTQIIIDFVDHSKKQLFWQAVSEFSFSPNLAPEMRERLFNDVAEKVLSNYPPEKKK
ncbi:DUF4136 domain-containing protein [Tamlana fucoidanivorans]|uniref:DUF4136 domain-containing protein n=1 Tax=Allotamlana fucoidanivorans TaxID=2583814 RepID=A0A5C4SKM4_9FLAO|nr:DUF4136 domain-containing protein [Tamlana fucoidanivorans]TNJ43785.1 DUF4136 domain-containing protein [Tamlana fucoidanivorans]